MTFIALPIGILLVVLLVGALMDGQLAVALAAGYALMSAASFAAYGFDKAAAKGGRFRAEESALHLMAFMGGWPGALVAQRVFRHKTVKQPFQTVFWATVIATCIALVAILVMAARTPG